MAKKTTRVRGYAPWSPEPESAAIVEQIQEVLRDYRQYLPLTLRQVFYRLVATKRYPKDEVAYKRLGELLNRARRARFIRFEDIRDDGVMREEAYMLRSVAHAMREQIETAEAYRLDRQRNQPTRLYVMCEAQGMVPQLVRVCDRYSITVQSKGGFDSVTVKQALARDLRSHGSAMTMVLHIGDHDPSGVHIFKSLEEDVAAFALEIHGGIVRFERLAVTPRQIIDLRLETAPKKKTDLRSFEGVGDDPTATVQAEAIPPDGLARIVEAGIHRHFDLGIYRRLLEQEKRERELVVKRVSKLRTRMPGRPAIDLEALAGAHDSGESVLALGNWSIREIANELGASKSVVQRYLAKQGLLRLHGRRGGPKRK